jgi:carboxynorspermidine decarboxylase
VKKSWFNGIARCRDRVRRLDGRIEVLREFTYEDYRASLS